MKTIFKLGIKEPLVILFTLFSPIICFANKPPIDVFYPEKKETYLNYISILQDEFAKKTVLPLINDDKIIANKINFAGTLSASDLLRDYKKNELSANKKYKNKRVRIRSVASEIGEDVTGKAYIKANGNNGLEKIMLYVDGSDQRILSLSRNDKIDFICKVNGYLFNTPILENCIFSSDFAEQIARKILPKNINMAKENYYPTNLDEALTLISYKINESNYNEECINMDDKCKNEISRHGKLKGDKKSNEFFKNNKQQIQLLMDHFKGDYPPSCLDLQ